MYIFSHLQAVLRMKSSPLTPQEIVRIQEVIRQPHPFATLIGNCTRMLSINLNPQGLKYFKYDWMSVWQFIVPYRDPSSLSRQWRTSLGIQKSYKLDAVKNEKRRLYESKRKSREQLTSGKEVCLPMATSQIIEPTHTLYLYSPFIAYCRTVLVLPRSMTIRSEMNWSIIQVKHIYMKDF